MTRVVDAGWTEGRGAHAAGSSSKHSVEETGAGMLSGGRADVSVLASSSQLSANGTSGPAGGQPVRRGSARSRTAVDGDSGSAAVVDMPSVGVTSGGARARLPGKASSRAQRGGNWEPVSDADGTGGGGGGLAAARVHAEAGAGGVWAERNALGLLVLLYMLQGIPMGLTLGALPFMLQSRLSYAQVGTFSLAAYPYSFKLLWSPIVDSLYSRRMGRRKTWIIPIQFCTAALLFGASGHIQKLYEAADVSALTAIFFLFVFLAATQDIAVDGWALTLLSPPHVSWASTCQTIGTSCGFFTSFTVFLALQDVKFCNTYVRSWSLAQRYLGADPTSPVALVTLPGYLRFWGVVFACVTAALWLFKSEGVEYSEEELAARAAAIAHGKAPARPGPLAEVTAAYTSLWGVVRLRAVWGLAALLLTYRLGVLVAEGAASLKLIDKGVPKETLAVLVLAQFPIELVSAVVAGRWAAAHSPAPPFLTSYFARLGINACTVALVSAFPAGGWGVPGSPAGRLFLWLAGLGLCLSAVSTLAFTSLGSLFNTISDPDMGGAYLTLLNTIANMGIIIPKAPAFYLIDFLTTSTCVPPADGGALTVDQQSGLAGLLCPKKPSELAGPSPCTAAGGACVITRDGFYMVTWASLALGAVLGVVYLRTLPLLMRLPISAWRATPASTEGSPAGGDGKAGKHAD